MLTNARRNIVVLSVIKRMHGLYLYFLVDFWPTFKYPILVHDVLSHKDSLLQLNLFLSRNPGKSSAIIIS